METTQKHLDLVLNGSLLQPVASQKLSIIVDRYLNWKEHFRCMQNCQP